MLCCVHDAPDPLSLCGLDSAAHNRGQHPAGCLPGCCLLLEIPESILKFHLRSGFAPVILGSSSRSVIRA
jgi:hypothetical protein